MKYIQPNAKVIEFDVASIILLSEIFCNMDSYSGGDLWEDDTDTEKGIPDFYNSL